MEKLKFNLFAILISLFFACKDTNALETKDILPKTNTSATILKKATKTYLSAWSDNDTVLLKMITINKLVRNVNGKIQSTNQSELFESMQIWHRAMPDFKMIDKEINVFENRTYVNWIGTGTNTGMFGDIPPTGKIGHTVGMSILTFDDEAHMVHESVVFDNLGLLKEWGYSISSPIME
ncbi:ester cyclase [uncultured Maribacter sp.]|uniref:ester cyclase n=1 Tax=uncultured Maribacter sp. TaxID=431308 RepID=UPI0030D96A35|tara:strand:- start:310 stop:846 length:537 start_codon:yes stop_codon:yes gene_type:complete